MKYLYQVVFEDEYLNLIEVGWYENLDDAIDDINGFIWEDAFKLQKGDLSVYPSTFGFAFDTCIYDIALTRHDEEELMDYQGGEMIRGFVHSFDNDEEYETAKRLFVNRKENSK